MPHYLSINVYHHLWLQLGFSVGGSSGAGRVEAECDQHVLAPSLPSLPGLAGISSVSGGDDRVGPAGVEQHPRLGGRLIVRHNQTGPRQTQRNACRAARAAGGVGGGLGSQAGVDKHAELFVFLCLRASNGADDDVFEQHVIATAGGVLAATEGHIKVN